MITTKTPLFSDLLHKILPQRFDYFPQYPVSFKTNQVTPRELPCALIFTHTMARCCLRHYGLQLLENQSSGKYLNPWTVFHRNLIEEV